MKMAIFLSKLPLVLYKECEIATKVINKSLNARLQKTTLLPNKKFYDNTSTKYTLSLQLEFYIYKASGELFLLKKPNFFLRLFKNYPKLNIKITKNRVFIDDLKVDANTLNKIILKF